MDISNSLESHNLFNERIIYLILAIFIIISGSYVHSISEDIYESRQQYDSQTQKTITVFNPNHPDSSFLRDMERYREEMERHRQIEIERQINSSIT